MGPLTGVSSCPLSHKNVTLRDNSSFFFVSTSSAISLWPVTVELMAPVFCRTSVTEPVPMLLVTARLIDFNPFSNH